MTDDRVARDAPDGDGRGGTCCIHLGEGRVCGAPGFVTFANTGVRLCHRHADEIIRSSEARALIGLAARPPPPTIAALEAALATCRAERDGFEEIAIDVVSRADGMEHAMEACRAERDAARADAAAARGALEKAAAFVAGRADETWDQAWKITLEWMAGEIRALDAAGRAPEEESV